MRIRSGHIVILVIVLIGAAFGTVLVVGGGTEAAPDAAAVRGASLPPVGSNPGDVPQIVVETKEKDMGVVPNKGLTVKPFVVRNTGKAPLFIREVKTSCACTTPLLTPDGLSIAPGAQGSFDIQIDPRRIPGFKAHKVLSILSNDPAKPQVEVGVTSHVDPEFTLTPGELNFGEVEKGDPATIKLEIKQLQAEPLEITGMNTHGSLRKDSNEADIHAKNFTFDVQRRPEDTWATPGKAEFDLTVSLTPEVAGGAINTKWVYVTTNIPRMPSLAIPVTGTVKVNYELLPKAPAKLNLKTDPTTGAFVPATASVSAASAVTIEAIDFAGAPLIVNTVAGDTPNEAKLNVNVRDDAAPGPLEATITFTIVVDGRRYAEHVGVRAFVAKNPALPPTN